MLLPVRLAIKGLGVSKGRGILNASLRRIAFFTAVIILKPYSPTLKTKRISLDRKPYSWSYCTIVRRAVFFLTYFFRNLAWGLRFVFYSESDSITFT